MSCRSLQSNSLLKLASLGMTCLAIATSDCFVPYCCASDSGLQGLPATPTEWVAAPKQVNLDKVARFRVPDGYKFASDSGARSFLQTANTPVPNGFVGVLAPVSGGAYVVLSYQETGFFNSSEAAKLAADTILKTIQKDAPKRSLTWEVAPSYNSAENYLESALRQNEGAAPQVYHTINWLTRNGVLTASAVYPKGALSPILALKDSLTSDSFKQGERYKDHQGTDRAARMDVASLLVQNATEEFATASSTDGTGSSRNPVLIGSVVGMLVCGLAGGGIVALRRYRKRSVEPVPLMVSEQHVPSRSTIISSHHQTNGHTAQTHNRPKLETSLSGLKRNGAKVNNNLANGDQRKRMFDYNRYFSDLMNAVSSSVHLEPNNINGHSPEASNGDNGNGDPIRAAAANLDVLNHQKLLIEEQKRLIIEQSRLIEEKSQLIAEKNRLLKMQSEWMENKLM